MNRPIKLATVIATVAAPTLLSACAAGDTASTPDSSATSSVTSETETNRRVMERFTSEFRTTGDPELAEEFLSPDVVIHFAGAELEGRDTYLGVVAANSAAFPDLVWTVDDIVADGDTLAVRYTMTGTHEGTFAGVAPTGVSVEVQSMAFYRLIDGQIVEDRAQLDMQTLLQQLGAIPAS